MRIDQNIDTIEQDLTSISSNIERVNPEIESTRQELKNAENKLNERVAVLNVRVKNIYMYGQASYLEVLLNAKSFSEFVTRFDFLQLILKQDAELVESIEVRRQDIANYKADLNVKLAELEKLGDIRTRQQDNVELAKIDRENKLEEIKTKQEAYEEAYQQIEEETKAIDDLIRRKSSKPGSENASDFKGEENALRH